MGTVPGPAEDKVAAALFGKTRRLILALMYTRPEESFYLREIIRTVGAGQGSVQRELQSLTFAGLLSRQTRGRSAYYTANRDSPVYSELRSLFVKTAGMADVVRRALRPLADRIEAAFIYGSAANRALRPGSDVDVMAIGTVAFSEVVGALAEAQRRLGREINPTVFDRTEFRRRAARKEHFVSSVLGEPKIFLIGDEHELDRLASKRVARRTQDLARGDSRPLRSRRARPPR